MVLKVGAVLLAGVLLANITVAQEYGDASDSQFSAGDPFYTSSDDQRSQGPAVNFSQPNFSAKKLDSESRAREESRARFNPNHSAESKPVPVKVPGVSARVISEKTESGYIQKIQIPGRRNLAKGVLSAVSDATNDSITANSETNGLRGEGDGNTPLNGCGQVGVEVIAKQITYGPTGPSVPVRVDFKFGTDFFVPLFDGGDIVVGNLDAINVGQNGGILNFMGRMAYPDFSNPDIHLEIESEDPANAVILLNGDNFAAMMTAKGVQPPYGGQLPLSEILAQYIDVSGNVTLGVNEMLVLFELGTTNQQHPAFDFNDLVLKVSTCGASAPGDIILDQVPGSLGLGAGSITYEVARAAGTYGNSGKRAVAYTEIDTTTPGAPVERLRVCMSGGSTPDWANCVPTLIRTRDISDSSAKKIRSIDLAISDGTFHGLGWVEVNSTSDTISTGAGQSTTFRYWVAFSIDDGQTWVLPIQVGSYSLNGTGVNYSGDIDLASNDAGKIGVLFGFDRGNPQATGLTLLGSATSNALVFLDYTPSTLATPAVFAPVTSAGTIDFPNQPGTRNMLDLVAGLGGSYVVNQGWVVNPTQDVFHAFYATGGTAKVYSKGIGTGNPPTQTRTPPGTGNGYPMATASFRNAVLQTSNGGVFELPPVFASANIWKRTPNVLERMTGNRVSDSIIGTEASIASNDPRTVEIFSMNTAGTVYGPSTISSPVILVDQVPFCADVTGGLCYNYGAQYDQEDRGTLIGSTYYSASIRRFNDATSNPEGGLINQLIIHTASNPPNFASNMSFDWLSLVNNSTNSTGGVYTMWNLPNSIWGTTASMWVPEVSGKLGVLRAIISASADGAGPNLCNPAPSIPGMDWDIRIWNSWGNLVANPQGGDAIVNYLDPSNGSTYLTQYGITRPAGCAVDLPTYDLRFDLSSSDIQVQAGQTYYIAVVAHGLIATEGSPFQLVSAVPPNIEYAAGSATGGQVISIDEWFPTLSRYGRSITVIPD